MKIILTLCFISLSFFGIFAQEKTQFSTSKKQVTIPFKLVNNLIIVPIKVNGTTLNFMLDTGVEKTILFSLDEKKELSLFNVEKIMLKGLGAQEAIEGLKSKNNKLSMNGLEFLNQEIVVVLDQDFNISSYLGIEVNGIIGSHFFSQNVVKINYSKKKISVFNPDNYNKNKVISKFKAFDFTLENAKPYIMLQVELSERTFDAKCLIDTGNSDGLWLFETKSKEIVIPKRNFEDFLGRGFSGAIFGKKAKTTKLLLDDYTFENVITAFPDSVSLANVKMMDNRLGSIGGEVLRRFNVIFDYKNNKLYLKKNKYFKNSFKYNTSGITFHHVGLEWYKEELRIDGLIVRQDDISSKNSGTELKYNFKLIPIYEILNVRKNSPAEKAGLLSGDVVVKINGNEVYNLSLDGINRLMKVEGQREVSLEVRRNGKIASYSFKTIDLL